MHLRDRSVGPRCCDLGLLQTEQRVCESLEGIAFVLADVGLAALRELMHKESTLSPTEQYATPLSARPAPTERYVA